MWPFSLMSKTFTQDEVEILLKKAYWAGCLGFSNPKGKLTIPEGGWFYANSIVTNQPVYDQFGKLITDDQYQIIL